MPNDMNLFLVEDDDLDAEILGRALCKIGASEPFVRAKDGQEALEILFNDTSSSELARPFTILLDINMPRMNGLEFLKALRGTDEIKDAHVVDFTTSESKKDIGIAYRNNVAGYIIKPNSSAELQEVLKSLRAFLSNCERPEMFKH